ncbi:T9SS type A sorting domain-containing protein [Bacteroidales bacterium OttesenSCG-928-K03]|nr:T9SS type A sorting domain-containing protein [Bacteroidales bacterium OttesenSCG-928-K22]MDL2242617.1 T9SS type A sorting domain-containing protein [Bacteroidales bacterium OttesenSCG-928-K03]
MVNLYYNEHIDVKLSEQYIMCEENKDVAWITSNSYNYFMNDGVPDNNCLPFSASLENCGDLCSNPDEIIQINGYSTYNSNASHEAVRQALIESGPLTGSGIPISWGTWTHAMALVGWGTIDEANVEAMLGYVPSYAPEWFGVTFWIYKQSMGISSNDVNNGFRYCIPWEGANPTTYKVTLPITSLNRTDADINCYDKDGDGYYFWGIGPKPSHCPTCPDEPDGDDSNPSLGPLNEFGQCAIIDNYNANFENGWDNWVQINADDGDWWRHTGSVIGDCNRIIEGAQDGDYYIYVNSNCNGCYSGKKFIIESPPINLNSDCEVQLEFYFHMYTYLWQNSQGEDNPDYTKLEVEISYNNGQTWTRNYPNYWYRQHNQGPGWHHAVVRIPSNVNKVRFVGTTGRSHMSDIALDNITIGPIKKSEPLTINSNTTWNSNRKIYDDIIVTNNSTLTIHNATITLLEDVKIFVKPGSKLVIDNATLTSNSCPDKAWYGIHVVGNGNQPQTPQYQGTVELYDANIENARFAIMTYDLTTNGNPDYSTTGGIIKAENTKFINNRKSAVFWAYPTNEIQTIPINISYFKDCTFIVDDDNLFESSNFDFESHISMWGVNGIKINGCNFENNMANSSERYQAIYTIDAGYMIDEICNVVQLKVCECKITPKRSVFKGFNKAIESSGTGSQYYIKIDRSDFENNQTGISISGMSNFQISRLNMSVNNSYTSSSTGIYIDNTTGYKIEENAIFSDGNKANAGIRINRAGRNENKIYRNEIYDLGYAINVTEASPVIVTPNERALPATGIQFICNDLYDNFNDIYVSSFAAIRASQGSLIRGADNLFTQTGGYDFYMSSHSIGNVDYYFNNAITRKTPINKTNNIILHNNATANPCSSSICSNDSFIDTIPPVDKSGISALSEYSEQNAKYSEMMSYFIAIGYEKVLTDYYNGIIEDEKLLEEAIEYHKEILLLTSYMAELSDNALFELKSDSIINLSQIRDWYEEIYTLSAKYSLAETYYQMGEYDEGFKTLNTIPKNFKLSESEKIEYENYLSLFTFKNDVRKCGRTIAELNFDEVEKLIGIAKASPGLSSVMANGILCFFYEVCLESEELPLDKSIEYGELTINNIEKKNIVHVYPNPGTTSVTVVSSMSGQLEFVNTSGQLLLKCNVLNGTNTIDVSSLPKGVYVYRVINGNNISATGKWVKM